MNLRVVFDTNILVSAALGTPEHLVPIGRPSLCLALALSGIVTPVVSDELLAEYGEVLIRPKFGFRPTLVARFLKAFRERADLVTAAKIRSMDVDPGDVHVLACAVGGKARFLVTGNVAHFPKRHRNVGVVTPAEFLKNLKLGLKS